MHFQSHFRGGGEGVKAWVMVEGPGWGWADRIEVERDGPDCLVMKMGGNEHDNEGDKCGAVVLSANPVRTGPPTTDVCGCVAKGDEAGVFVWTALGDFDAGLALDLMR